jgi:hypothetical protein
MMVQVGQLDASCHGWVSARNERKHPAGPDSREREGQPKKIVQNFWRGRFCAACIANCAALGLGTWTPTASIHAGGVVSPSLGDILSKRIFVARAKGFL